MPAAPPPHPASAARPDTPPCGLLVLHGNRLETLHQLLLHCQQRWPLAALEPELVLVQSHGAGEWFKAAQAQATGISAGTRVELPSRFAWQVYRRVLGAAKLGARSPLDRQALAWRLMHALPRVCASPGFDVLAGFLRDDDPLRLLQLAQRLADLYDQYQVYRADWLDLWSHGIDVTVDARGRRAALAPAQRWQALLWRELLDGLGDEARLLVRPQVHQRVLQQLRAAPAGSLQLPPRISLFGASTLAPSLLELLVALARHAQVLVAVPNPCRFHWADIVEGRELLRVSRRRQPLRDGRELAQVELSGMHAHAHPLLAAWGRQGRDFMRQLDASEAPAPDSGELPRTDVFDEQPAHSLLQHVQAAIRDLLPLAEHAAPPLPDDDDSIQFHVTHGSLREVEVLHDRLLDMLARPGRTLRPRDIVVMVPDIEEFAPAVRAVFGQYAYDDPRRIPFDIADLHRRNSHSLLLALEWLLGIARRRVTLSEVCDLLDVPAVAARFGLDPADRPLLARWMAQSGARWGLHERQRASLGLQACGEAASWDSGMRRMLLGYASGDGPSWNDIVPLQEIGGLDAALVGTLHDLLEVLRQWWEQSRVAATPAQWAERARELLRACVSAQDDSDRQALAAMQEGLAQWLHDCECAGFEQPVPAEVFAEAWLARIDDSSASGRFLAGGVTFCSLLPLRAIPFQVVCLLGMNDDAYPRAGQRNDFDLMAQPGQFRAGDRSRRDDDRYLMLEALLSARQTLYISWRGRSARDNTELPPSVLVSQLRDYLAAGFAAQRPRPGESPGQALLRVRTTEYPLQPFSRRYFEAGGPRTYAREWFALHTAPRDTAAAAAPGVPESVPPTATLRELAAMLANPVRLYFRARLDVALDEIDDTPDDDEVFGLHGLARHDLLQQLLRDPGQLRHEAALPLLRERLRRAAADGLLPLGGPGRACELQLEQELAPLLQAWGALARRHALAVPRLALRHAVDCDGARVELDDWIDGLRREHPQAPPLWLELRASRLLRSGSGSQLRVETLLPSWVRMLGVGALGLDCEAYVLAPDAAVHLRAPRPGPALDMLRELLCTWRRARMEALPWGRRSAVAQARQRQARGAYEGVAGRAVGDRDDPSLARVYPDFDALSADGRFAHYVERLFVPLCEWAQHEARVVDARELVEAAQGARAHD